MYKTHISPPLPMKMGSAHDASDCVRTTVSCSFQWYGERRRSSVQSRDSPRNASEAQKRHTAPFTYEDDVGWLHNRLFQIRREVLSPTVWRTQPFLVAFQR